MNKNQNTAPVTESYEQLTSEEIETVVRLLDRLPKGFLPLPIFEAVAAKVTTPSIELIPYRITESGKVQVLMTRRGPDDKFWPNEWHAPGTILRATDEENTYNSAFQRITNGELMGEVEVKSEPEYYFTKFDEVRRGRELRQVFAMEVAADDESLVSGQFFDIDNLPEDTIEHHKTMLEQLYPELIARHQL